VTRCWSAPTPRYDKAKDMRCDPRVGLSPYDLDNPYRMAALEARVVEICPDSENGAPVCARSSPECSAPCPGEVPSRGPLSDSETINASAKDEAV